MSPLAPLRKRTLSAVLAASLALALTVVSLPRVAHADLGDEPSSKSTSSEGGAGQAEDADKPKDGSLLEKKPADAAVQKAAEPSTPFYEKWQFWAITGAVIVGAIALIWGGQALAHQLNGGDVRPCNTDFEGRCFGEGR